MDDETPLSLFQKAVWTTLGVFVTGMLVLFYFIATGQTAWALFWWATLFGGVILCFSLGRDVLRAHMAGARLSFDRAIVGPATIIILCWIAAFVASGLIG